MAILSPPAAALTGDLYFGASQALATTLSIHAPNLGPIADNLAAGRPVIGTGWHGQVAVALGVMPRLLRRQAIAIMTLSSFRGRVLGRYAQRLGIHVVSLNEEPLSRLQGAARINQLTRSGHLAFLAADGPDGPAQQAKEAIVLVAQRAGAVLVPCAFAANRCVELSWRWDRHVVPLPGARVVIQVGAAIDVGDPGDAAAVPQAHTSLQRALVDVNSAARDLLGTGGDRQAAHAI